MAASNPVDDQRQPLSEQSALPDEYPAELVRTALCIEAREGRLYCFTPPLTHLEHWLDLVASLEATAAETGLRIIVEGYEPPRDFRLTKLAVTPDPGVIEVNVHPASSWDDLVRDTTILYEEARLTRLGTEKFMLDGRHTGTGGGNHVTLGGPTPADSPLLRRPDLIQSLITYWQHHPSLSYLFSGTFIGPTSQAPRVDEARDDSLYELAIAFQQMPKGNVNQPWIVDRVLRNLLADVTGNTHRTEFCIDKLYSPDSASGRQGLVEFRAFEMPPHARMSLAQILLLRTFVARFWKEPYSRKPIRWGTELHDRFLLPHFARQDFDDVICDLQRAGYPFDPAWFDPFFEFRFPHYGDLITGNGIKMELRGAIEPWHVLGEEVTAQGTSRFVDSRSSACRSRSTAWSASATRSPATAAACPASHRAQGRVRRRRALQGLEPAVRPAPHHPVPQPAGLRRGGPLESRQPRRLQLLRLPPRRPRRRALPDQQLRGREPAHRPLPAHGPHPRRHRPAAGRARRRASVYAGSALGLCPLRRSSAAAQRCAGTHLRGALAGPAGRVRLRRAQGAALRGMKIAILSRNAKLYSTRRLVEAARQRGHEARVIDVLRCYMNITSHRPSIHYKGES
jgi:hypothetical protein